MEIPLSCSNSKQPAYLSSATPSLSRATALTRSSGGHGFGNLNQQINVPPKLAVIHPGAKEKHYQKALK